MAEISPAALASAAETRRLELPAAVALVILTGGIAAAIMGGVGPIGWSATMTLTLIFDAEIYRRLDIANRPVKGGVAAWLAAWAFFTSAAYVVLPAGLWLDGRAAGAAAAMILWVGSVVRHIGRGSGSLSIAVAGAAPPALSLLLAPVAIAASATRPDWDLAIIAAIGGGALMVYVAHARIRAVEAERALRHAAANENLQHTLAQLLLDHAALSAFLVDREGRIVAASKRERGEDVVGRRFEEACEWTPLRWRENFERVLQGEHVIFEEDQVVTSSGMRWMNWQARPWRGADSAICGALAFGRDITARVEARRASQAYEARLQVALEAGRSVIWEMDLKHRVITWCGDPTAIYGGEIQFNDFNASVLPMLADEDRAFVQNSFDAAIAGHIESFEHRLRKPNGELAWVQVWVRAIPGRSGDIRRVIGLTKDVTERRLEEQAFLEAMRHAEATMRAKRALLMDAGAPQPEMAPEPSSISVAYMFERLNGLLDEMKVRDGILADTLNSLRAARESAEEANVSKSQFLTNMSHELRTPLNAIIGYSEILMEEAEADGRSTDQKDIERVLDSARQSLHLINGILDLSKIEAGRMDVVAADFDIAKLIRDAAAIIRPAAERNSNVVEINIENDLGLAHNDAFKLNQCLLNLLSNACKFTHDGKIGVRAKRNASAQGDWLEISVSDSGIGLTDEQMTKLFQPFMQAEVSTARRFGGTGLGLAITRRLAELLGGEVSATSAANVGSTFTLRIPAKLGDVAPDARALNVDRDSENVVLVIDDDKNALELATRSLTRLGFLVSQAETGKDGLELARSLKPNAIVLDINLPDFSGWALFEALRASSDTADIPVIVHSVDGDRKRATALGAAAHLVKPADRDVLAAAVARAARSQHFVSSQSARKPTPTLKTA